MARHVAYVPVRWADLDAFGHVNNVVFLRYLQEARVDMLFIHAPLHGAGDLAAGLVVARHSIDYLAPLRFRADPVRVETWVTDVRNATFTLGYEIVDDANPGRTTYATASTKLVPYHLGEQRPRRLTDAEKAVLEGFRQ